MFPPSWTVLRTRLRDGFLRTLGRRHGGLVLFVGVFAAIALGCRLVLLAKAAGEASWNASLLAAFAWGLLYDLATAGWIALPLALVLALLPAKFFAWRLGRFVAHLVALVTLYLLLFGAVAEWLFWDEFGVRFNFIAVDYLVYTTEVVGNIRESYPMPAILGGIAVGALALWWLVLRSGLPARWFAAAPERFGRRLAAGGLWALACGALGTAVDARWLPDFANNYNRELAKNGLWSLVAAFRDNELDFDQFYPTLPAADTFARLRPDLQKDGSLLLRPGALDTLRFVRNAGPELHPNIVQITVESLSAEFLGCFNPASSLTPELDALAPKSLLFTNLYATGTRTDRGMEALTLSLPPTPGRSLVKRPRNEDLFSLGSVLRTRGYDTAFIYGGYGYFDNMNYFFAHNGYRVIDRAAVADDDVTFANVWGACDEDLYRWTLREADAVAAAGRPFHFFLMTTSNHRPFTFPDGRIDLPSKESGRDGGVKYTDYAIGKFLRDAADKPWFKNTVFVIVADHCASSAGRAELPVENYRIPMLIYAPGGQIAPGRVDVLTSQIDFAPTLLGLLGWSYPSRFFGYDVRKIRPEEAHAFIGNYQKLGLLEDGRFVILKPLRARSSYTFDRATGALKETPAHDDIEREAIGFYGGASYLYRHDLYRALTPAEFQQYTALGNQLADAPAVPALSQVR